MPRKKKIQNLTQTHAKVATSQLTNLDQIWGFNESARYGTIDPDIYAGKLREMTRADLENHARAVGCLVVEDSERLRKELLKMFHGYISSLKKPSPVAPGMTKISPEAQKVLNEGR